MTYQETIDYLFSQLPVYQRVGKAAYKADLNSTIELLQIVGNPQHQFKSVHIAGTNGKGSTAHLMASVFQEAGYKTGLYTSPHLKDFRERIRINGRKIPEVEVVQFVQKYETLLRDVQPSFFEWSVGLAFTYFQNEKVDVAILETGMGGRLDSTNVVNPELSVITNIGMDHTAFLGKTLPLIAAEKAGIIKNQVPVVIGKRQDEIDVIFEKKAAELNCEIHFANEEITEVPNDGNGLIGSHQEENKKTALCALRLIDQQFPKLSEKAIESGFNKVIENTGLQGRWQVLSKNPLTICDTGHNEDGIQAVLKQIKRTKYDRLHMIFGTVNDKELAPLTQLLPKEAIYYFCQPKIPRALEASKLAAHFLQSGFEGEVFDSVPDALQAATLNAKEKDLVFVGGSTFVVAEVI